MNHYSFPPTLSRETCRRVPLHLRRCKLGWWKLVNWEVEPTGSQEFLGPLGHWVSPRLRPQWKKLFDEEQLHSSLVGFRLVDANASQNWPLSSRKTTRKFLNSKSHTTRPRAVASKNGKDERPQLPLTWKEVSSKKNPTLDGLQEELVEEDAAFLRAKEKILKAQVRTAGLRVLWGFSHDFWFMWKQKALGKTGEDLVLVGERKAKGIRSKVVLVWGVGVTQGRLVQRFYCDVVCGLVILIVDYW